MKNDSKKSQPKELSKIESQRKEELTEYHPTNAEKKLSQELQNRRETKTPPPKLLIDDDFNLTFSHADLQTAESIFRRTFGTDSQEFAELMMSDLINTEHYDHKNPGDLKKINGLLAAVSGIAPKDEAEALLAVQMTTIHQTSLSCLRRANAENQTFAGRMGNINQAVKLMRTYTAQLESLNKYRGKGRQKMTVEHVHVHEGGQAIVGNITKGGG